jgi:hypothetical protein
MLWREKNLHLSIGCVGNRTALDAVERGISASCYYNSHSLFVHIVASGCVRQQSVRKKSERKEEKIMEQWSRIYNEELHNLYLHFI